MLTGMQRIAVLREIRKPEICFPSDFDFNIYNDQAAIIKKLLNHVPRERPSCLQLLQSPLVPANIEEESINKDLLRVVRQRNPTYFTRLISALFDQNTDIHKDFAYDFNAKSNTFDSLTCLIGSQMSVHARMVFARHGALQILPPHILPKSEIIQSIHSAKKPAEYLDQNGDVVHLIHDLTVPFARSLAQTTEENLTFPLKRFAIETVFRNNLARGQPRKIQECDFDIVYHAVDISMVPEAEVIKTVFEVF